MKIAPTVYVIDDEEVIRDSFEMFLGIMQIPVRTFTSADEFLAAYDEAWRGIVIADIRMTGMNGLMLAKELSLRKSNLATVLMTGNADDTLMQQALEAGAITLLQKPISLDSLRGILQTHFAVK